MGRAISKALVKSVIYLIVGEHADNLKFIDIENADNTTTEVWYTDTIECDMKVSNAKARTIVANQFGTNATITYINNIAMGRVVLDDDYFYNYSEVCEDGKVYGHDTITKDFKMTQITVLYIDTDTHKPIVTHMFYMGHTTQNKLLKFVRDTYKTGIIQNVIKFTVKRWMLKSTYTSLCEKYGKVVVENDTNSEE